MNILTSFRFICWLTLSCSITLSCTLSKKEKKKIVYINSYHQGHPSSDEIMQGFMDNMSKDAFDIYAWYMDTKRNPSEDYINEMAKQLLDSIQRVDPEILVVSDDNAVKYIVEPNIESLDMPVLFCGVNWTDNEYNLPKEKVTGILEILPVTEALQTIKTYYPAMEKVLVLSENTTTSRKEEQILDTLFQRVGFVSTYELVDDFEQWKSDFLEANKAFDLIYIPTHAAVKDWDHEEAVTFINQHVEIPIITCEDFMMPYAVLGYTKVAKEHGEWAAATAKKIFAGASIEDFPVTRNHESVVWLNSRLAEKIDFNPDAAFLEKAKLIE